MHKPNTLILLVCSGGPTAWHGMATATSKMSEMLDICTKIVQKIDLSTNYPRKNDYCHIKYFGSGQPLDKSRNL